MSCISILRIGPFPVDNDCASRLREAILQYLVTTATTATANNNSSIENTSDIETQRYQFFITNRYFTAKVRLTGIEEDVSSFSVVTTDTTTTESADTTTRTTTTAMSYSEDGMILVFDAEQSHPKYATSMTSSFDVMEPIHDRAVSRHQCGELLRLCVSIGHPQRMVQTDGTIQDLSDKEYEEEYSRRILWCLDHGYEYIEIPDLSDTSQGHDVRDKDGFARLIEAISGTVWTSAIMESKQQQKLQQSFAETRSDIQTTSSSRLSLQPPPPIDDDDVNEYEPPNPLDFPSMVGDENDQERERQAREALLADCVNETPKEDATSVNASTTPTINTNTNTKVTDPTEEWQQERAMNALEASLNEARRIRELSKSGQLSDDERRKRASDAAMLILQTMEQMGFDDDDDEDEDEDDNSLVDET